MNKRTLLVILPALLCMYSTNMYAQTQHSFSGWSAMFASYKLSSKFSIHFDGQLRSTDEWKQLQTYLIRPGLHYHVRKNMIATVGYAYVGNYRQVTGITGWAPEHRIWEQFIINQSLPVSGHATSLQHRFRLEQRFIGKSVIENGELTTDGHHFTQRLRYFARGVFPLKSAKAFTKGAFVSLQNEVFANVMHASATNDKFFDQNRAYVSVGYRISARYDIETGYMNQFVAGRTSNTVNNILQLAGYLRL